MTMPLFQPLFPPTEFDLFLEEIGVAPLLSPEQKESIVRKTRAIVQYKVANAIFDRLDSQEKAEEFERLMAEVEKEGDHVALNQFLLKEIPDWETLTDTIIEEVKQELRQTFSHIPELVSKGLVTLGRDPLNYKNEQKTPTPEAQEEPFPFEANPEKSTELPDTSNSETVSTPTSGTKANETVFPWEQTTYTPPASVRESATEPSNPVDSNYESFDWEQTSTTDNSADSQPSDSTTKSQQAIKEELNSIPE